MALVRVRRWIKWKIIEGLLLLSQILAKSRGLLICLPYTDQNWTHWKKSCLADSLFQGSTGNHYQSPVNCGIYSPFGKHLFKIHKCFCISKALLFELVDKSCLHISWFIRHATTFFTVHWLGKCVSVKWLSKGLKKVKKTGERVEKKMKIHAVFLIH